MAALTRASGSHLFPASSVLVVLSLHLLSTLVCAVPTAGFSTELIHVDSPLSPLYDPSKTWADRMRASAKRSLSRASLFNMTNNRLQYSSADAITVSALQSDLIGASHSEYLMRISIGTPAVQYLMIADTGSDLIWTQCLPCTACYSQSPPLFDPTKSSSYKQLPCDAPRCTAFSSAQCDNSRCIYSQFYGDKSYSKGELASETFTFDTSGSPEGGHFLIDDIAFGCSHEASDALSFASKSIAGLVGLGAGQLSLISQLGTIAGGKFSYCLIPYDHPQQVGILNFGDTVSGPQVVSTPMVLRPTTSFYYLILEEIIVGNVRIPVEGSNSDDGNIIIDSGTTNLLIPTSLAKQVEKAVVDFVGLPNSGDPDGVVDVCFDTSKTTKSVTLPDVVYQFRGASVTVDSNYMFSRPYDNILCLLMIGVDNGLPIFGNAPQQNLRVGYDIVAKKIAFDPTGCGI